MKANTAAIRWSPQQDAALKAVRAWLKDRGGPQIFRLFGWAGTGKSTLAMHLAGGLKKVVYAAFTGKAALVMQKRGCTDASTIHSLIYNLEDDRGGEPTFVLNRGSAVASANLVVIDEVSMVGKDLAMDLLSFGTSVLVLGDPFQLPPVKDTGFFTVGEPDIMLTEIHRQAADNPIIRMSIDIREGRGLAKGSYGASRVIPRADVDQDEVMAASQVIVGRNLSRVQYNDRFRAIKGLPAGVPVVGDKLVCLRNNREKRLLNGQIWIVSEVTSHRGNVMKLLVEPEDAGMRVSNQMVVTHQNFFNGTEDRMTWEERRRYDEFCFGYALTCHKAQGSQWDDVYLFDESAAFREERSRWLYTAVTRAAERITVAQ